MADTIYSTMSWLPAAPADFAEQCKGLSADSQKLVASLRFLASHALSLNQLTRLDRTLARLKSSNADLAGLSPFRLGVISNATTDFMVPAITASALRFGVLVECVTADYGQAMQSALDPASRINQAGCDAVLLALDYRAYPFHSVPGDAEAAAEQEKHALAHLAQLRDGLRKHGKAPSIVQTLARPPEVVFGNLEAKLVGTLGELITTFNRMAIDSLRETTDLLLDVAGIAETVGLAAWHDPTQWNLAKIPFASEFIPLYADNIGRVLGAIRGKSRKCLALDLDNTLWGGVIGDDGVEGILIGQGDPTAEAHLSVQHGALQLRQRGIVLAVSSKNTDEIARTPFQKHPEMLLREEHLAAFQANWSDKATNLSTIANTLALGIDSLVFLDDNPFERNFVRTSLPQVAVPELPENPALYARTLAAAGYFEALDFSAEDRARAAFYQENAKRAALQEQVGDLEGYLKSLDMTITFRPFDEQGVARISQLINKSNQFNLTTHRYTESQVRELAGDTAAFTLQVRLTDRFGDNGMISVIICLPKADEWHIDTWLMSCRVLGRQVETAVLREIGINAAKAGIRTLVGEYIPSEKNDMVRGHYEKLGFQLREAKPDGRTTWALPVSSTLELTAPMEVDR